MPKGPVPEWVFHENTPLSKCHFTWESCEETCACSIENGMIAGRGYYVFFHASISRSTVKV